MTRVYCPLKDCSFRARNGCCQRSTIALGQTEDELNELLCAGFMDAHTRLFAEASLERMFDKHEPVAPHQEGK